jgi:translation initiation factor 3 subunit D
MAETSSPLGFILPKISENPSGWGPFALPEQFKDIPYQPFSKSDRLGKVI